MLPPVLLLLVTRRQTMDAHRFAPAKVRCWCIVLEKSEKYLLFSLVGWLVRPWPSSTPLCISEAVWFLAVSTHS